MLRKMIVAGALVVGSVGMGAGVASAGDPESPAEVLPTTLERTQVGGTQALPQTGSDLDADILFGVGLTAAGVALAVAARQRRRRVEVTSVASTPASS